MVRSRNPIGWPLVSAPRLGEFGVAADTERHGLAYALAAGASTIESIERSTADVIVFGQGGLGLAGEITAARLAASRDATLVLDVLEVEPRTAGWWVKRDLGQGAREILTLSSPVVLVISELAAIPFYVSRFRQARAAASLANPTANSSDSLPKTGPISWEPLRPRTKTRELAAKTGGAANEPHVSGLRPGRVGEYESVPDNCCLQRSGNGSHPSAAIPGPSSLCRSSLSGRRAWMPCRNKNASTTPSGPRFAAEFPAATDVAMPPGRPSDRQARAPRPLAGGGMRALARRPRAYAAARLERSSLIRKPRPLGQLLAGNIRGPYPWKPTRPLLDSVPFNDEPSPQRK